MSVATNAPVLQAAYTTEQVVFAYVVLAAIVLLAAYIHFRADYAGLPEQYARHKQALRKSKWGQDPIKVSLPGGDAFDAEAARDRLHEARQQGVSAAGTVGTPTISTAYRQAREDLSEWLAPVYARIPPTVAKYLALALAAPPLGYLALRPEVITAWLTRSGGDPLAVWRPVQAGVETVLTTTLAVGLLVSDLLLSVPLVGPTLSTLLDRGYAGVAWLYHDPLAVGVLLGMAAGLLWAIERRGRPYDASAVEDADVGSARSTAIGTLRLLAVVWAWSVGPALAGRLVGGEGVFMLVGAALGALAFLLMTVWSLVDFVGDCGALWLHHGGRVNRRDSQRQAPAFTARERYAAALSDEDAGRLTRVVSRVGYWMLVGLAAVAYVARRACRQIQAAGRRGRAAASVAADPPTLLLGEVLLRRVAGLLAGLTAAFVIIYAVVAVAERRIVDVLAALAAAPLEKQLLVAGLAVVPLAVAAYATREHWGDIRAAVGDALARRAVRVVLLARATRWGVVAFAMLIAWSLFGRATATVLIGVLAWLGVLGIQRALRAARLAASLSLSSRPDPMVVPVRLYALEDADGGDRPYIEVGSHAVARATWDDTIDEAVALAADLSTREGSDATFANDPKRALLPADRDNERATPTAGTWYARDLLEFGIADPGESIGDPSAPIALRDPDAAVPRVVEHARKVLANTLRAHNGIAHEDVVDKRRRKAQVPPAEIDAWVDSTEYFARAGDRIVFEHDPWRQQRRQRGRIERLAGRLTPG